MKKFTKFIKEHKKEIIIGGCCLATIVAGIVIYKSVSKQSLLYDEIQQGSICTTPKQLINMEQPISNEKTTEPIDNSTSQKRNYTKPDHEFGVAGHLRRLHEGQKHSSQNETLARDNGIDLPEGYSFVPPYPKNRMSMVQ